MPVKTARKKTSSRSNDANMILDITTDGSEMITCRYRDEHGERHNLNIALHLNTRTNKMEVRLFSPPDKMVVKQMVE